MFDSYKRSITYLRISVTDRCNLRCIYCMPEEGITLLPHQEFLSYEQIISIAGAASRLGIDKIRLTGGEPLVRKNIAFLISGLKAISGIREVALTTNATLLPDMVGELKASGLDRLNISLDTLDPEKYRRITRIGRLEDALSGIEAARAAGFLHTKVNMVVIPGKNDGEIDSMQTFCREKNLELQRIRKYSLRQRVSSWSGMDAERPLDCRSCNRIRLTADGMLKPCLFSDQEYPVDMTDPVRSIEETIRRKPRAGKQCRKRQVWQIGG